MFDYEDAVLHGTIAMSKEPTPKTIIKYNLLFAVAGFLAPLSQDSSGAYQILIEPSVG